MIGQPLDGERDHFSLPVTRPGTADLLWFVSVVVGAMTIDDLNVATALLCPQTMSTRGASVNERCDTDCQLGGFLQHDGDFFDRRLTVRLTVKLRGSPGITQ